MGKLIGIDLGTTNSAVAIIGEYGESENRYGRVSILPDEYNRTIHASVICDCDGQLVFSDDAKYMAAEGYAPICFWKRHMGKGITFPLLGKEQQPQDLSRYLLEYLKQVAEKILGEKVDGAVITHPAYFGGDAMAATRGAGDSAGLNVGEDGLLMEQIAAALAYLSDDPDKDKTKNVLVYDLGGGTFDITVLQRSNGEFVPLSFDGDPELGGYNFDKALANHLLKHLIEQGYHIKIDPDHPERNPRWAGLMHIAEEAKLKLSQSGQSGMKVDIRKPRIFLDDDKKSVQLNISITRDEFEKMINPLIDHTIECCKRALKKAKLSIDEIDHAILIGGSSRLPLVQGKLKEEFNREFELEQDMVDLAVAIGAAIQAGSGPVVTGVFSFKQNLPEVTSDTPLVITGNVVPSEDVAEVAGCTVTLTRDDFEESQLTSPEGGFFFEVDLEENSENEIHLQAVTTDGKQIGGYTKQVRYDPDAGLDGPPSLSLPSYLAKTLCIDTANRGLQPIPGAEEGLPLPLDTIIDNLKTAGDKNAEVRIELYQEDQHLVDIVLTDFPASIPRGTPVRVTVHVHKDYQMSAKAEIPSIPGAEKEVLDIKIPAPLKPKVQDMRTEADRLRREIVEFLQNFPPGDEKIHLGAETDRILNEVTKLLDDTAADTYRIQRLLKNLDRLMREHSVDYFQPSPNEMQEMIAKARKLLPQAEAKDESLKQHQIGKTLDVLAKEADEAYQSRDRQKWISVAERVKQICEQLEQINSGGTGGGELPSAPVLFVYLKQQLGQLESVAQQKGRSGDPDVQQALQAARQELNAIDANSPGAQMELVRIYQGPISRLQQLLNVTPQGGGGGGVDIG